MRNKKNLGSYYTPKIVADFLVGYLSDKITKSNLSILEPSCGDGAFIRSIYENKSLSVRIKQVVAVERQKRELLKAKAITTSITLVAHHADFLKFQLDNKDKFDVVIGNPPYIKKSLLTKKQISLCEEIHRQYPLLSGNSIKNIWTAFLVRSVQYVSDTGVLALVLPAELLQVKYAAELRALVISQFERTEVFSFNELLFNDSKGQDTVLLVCEKKAAVKGVYYCNVEKVTDLNQKTFSFAQNISVQNSKKWTHYHLTSDEMELLEKLRKPIKTVKNYCASKVGIVTAANDYFIVNKAVVNKFSLQRFVKPIVLRGAFMNGSVILTPEEFESLVSQSKQTFLIAINETAKIKRNTKLHHYLQQGIKRKLFEGSKASQRANWYAIPNIEAPPEAFFLRRCDEYPKLIKNEANVLVTDTAYQIKMNQEFDLNSLVHSFYNSLTLTFAELDGRFYGGGVLELTPNEFKGLPIPYVKISTKQFDVFAEQFKSKNSINDVCKANDPFILKSTMPGISDETIDSLLTIRKKLYNRRIKSSQAIAD